MMTSHDTTNSKKELRGPSNDCFVILTCSALFRAKNWKRFASICIFQWPARFQSVLCSIARRLGRIGLCAGRLDRLERSSQFVLNRLAVPTAERELCTGSQDNDVIAVKRRLQFLNAIDVDHRGAVNAQEFSGIQSGFQI